MEGLDAWKNDGVCLSETLPVLELHWLKLRAIINDFSTLSTTVGSFSLDEFVASISKRDKYFSVYDIIMYDISN